MKYTLRPALLLAGFYCFSLCVPAQSLQSAAGSAPAGKSIKAIGYEVEGLSTLIDLKGTSLMPQAKGRARIEAKKGMTLIDAEVSSLAKPSTLGTEFLTCVLWAVTPDGRTLNLGEIQLRKSGSGRANVTTQLQTFSLIVTVEPYFSVRQPSDLVVLVNEVRKRTKGKVFMVQDYKLLKRGQYERMENPLALSPDLKNAPLDVFEARNALEIARTQGAEHYASEIFPRAEASLKIAETLLAHRGNKKEIVSTSRQAVQIAEDARALSVERQEQERIARERGAAAAQARAEAEATAAQERARQAQLAAAREAQLRAEAAARQAQADRIATIAAARAKADGEAWRAKEEAARADATHARRAAEELRAKLLEQFSRILETRDTPRGLVANMGDVLFDTGRFDLRPPAREILAKLSGIVLAHPGLILEVEGHTDSVGSDEFNQKLSDQRAQAVRSYLLEQGLDEKCITATGFGKSAPVADNATASGRQRNRRVEIIISGEVIGKKIGR